MNLLGRLWKTSPPAPRRDVPDGFHEDFLERLERESRPSDYQRRYLWPRTPIEDIQAAITRRVGFSDHEVAAPGSRPRRVIDGLGSLRASGRIPERFSVLDIACGDALILWHVKRAFPHARCMGIDCNKGRFASHESIEKDGVRIYRAYIQDLFGRDLDFPVDVALMLNTYRGWESADLRTHERSLPDEVDRWFERNARFVVLTATRRQLARLRRLGFRVRRMGPGEDDSPMACLEHRG